MQLRGIDQASLNADDFFDILEVVLADAIDPGGLAGHKRLRDEIARQVSLTPDRATWGMDVDVWGEVPAAAAPRSELGP